MLKTQVDPFTVEIIRSGLVATTDEMKTNLMRTAYNRIVYEALDFTVALTDSKGNLVSIGLGLPSFIRGISDTVKAMIEHFGDDVQPGDILLTNDAYTHGSHLNHVIAALPVFHRGRIVAFACSEPHWQDIGGVLGGNRTDIYSEGLQLPYLKIYKHGDPNQDVLDIIKMNVRNPDLAMGDFRGQLACIKTGERRIARMVEKYGVDTFTGALDMLMDQAEDFSRSQIRKIPEGTYEAEEFLDDDGMDIGKEIPVRVKVTVKDDSMSVDLSGVGRQVRGFYNSGAGLSGTQMGFKSIVCPTWFPINDGSFRPLHVTLPPGTVASAVRPSAMYMWMDIPMTIADTMWKAMAPALPQGIAAGHFGDLCISLAFIIDPQTRMPIFRRAPTGGGTGGGFGAKHDSDGMPAMICLNDGDTHNGAVEAQEAHEPDALVLTRELWQDSGGAGEHRGGLGTSTETVYLKDALLNSYMDRTMCPSWGAFGAKPGLANRLMLLVAKEKLQSPEDYQTRKVLSLAYDTEVFPNAKMPNAKFSNRVVPAGSRVVNMPGGGGGFGKPTERDPELVLNDVVNGYVSLEAARRDYGVVVRPDLTIDLPATKALRGSP
jgi:N-methylhydantoinase B